MEFVGRLETIWERSLINNIPTLFKGKNAGTVPEVKLETTKRIMLDATYTPKQRALNNKVSPRYSRSNCINGAQLLEDEGHVKLVLEQLLELEEKLCPVAK